MSCDHPINSNQCVTCLTTAVEKEIFQLIHEEQNGEMDEELYATLLDRGMHQEIDYCIMAMRETDCERMIHQYGIHEAIHEYIAEYGEIHTREDVNVCRTLLYSIIRNSLKVTLADYQTWCYNSRRCTN